MIDFRSDTVSKPSPGMLKAMMAAEVGDDVFSEDPTVNRLEEKAANMFNMEAALFCPSGTMTNQVAIKTHTQPGDEIICEEGSHVYQYEGGGIAFNSGASVKLLVGNRGRITATQVADSINPDDVHKPISRLVCIENTHNRGGGSCYDITEMEEIKSVCDQNGLKLHLDGARLFNAIVAKQEKPEQYGKIFDSISLCLSKGLGCPVGSLLIGNKDFIKKARRIRKVFGGGMRQAGYMAAAGLFALENNIDRLAEDHRHAKKISDALSEKQFIKSILPVETNIIIFIVKGIKAESLVKTLEEKGIRSFAMSPSTIRFVLHLDITDAMVEKTISIIRSL